MWKHLLLVWQLILTSAPISHGSRKCFKEVLHMGHKTFYFSDNKLSWEDSESYCERTCGGHLAQPQTQEENKALSSRIYHISSKCDFGYIYWIGIRLQNNGHSFRFVQEDKKPTYVYWASGEPTYSYRGIKEKCVQFKCYGKPGVHWNDHICQRHNLYICEVIETPKTTSKTSTSVTVAATTVSSEMSSNETSLLARTPSTTTEISTIKREGRSEGTSLRSWLRKASVISSCLTAALVRICD